MKDQEILTRRAELKARSDQIWKEWRAYDERYPVLPGAYQPPDYYEQQRLFSRRLSVVSDEMSALPRTSVEKLRLALTWIAIIAVVLICAALLIWRAGQ